MPILPLLLLAMPAPPATARELQPGAWSVTSTVVSMDVPGVPGFIQRMVRGKSKAEHKRLATGQGIQALLAPDPRANCHIDDHRVADIQYDQRLSCPQKRGGPLSIVRSGTFDASGFRGRATVDGQTPKGTLRIVLDQRAGRTGS